MKHDPTRTTMLRNQYSRQLTRMYKRFAKNTIPKLVEYTTNYRDRYHMKQFVKKNIEDFSL